MEKIQWNKAVREKDLENDRYLQKVWKQQSDVAESVDGYTVKPEKQVFFKKGEWFMWWCYVITKGDRQFKSADIPQGYRTPAEAVHMGSLFCYPEDIGF